MLKKMSAQKKGFTLIELMITISIVAIISAIGLVSYSQTQKIARDARRKEDLRSIAIALELYRQKNHRYPCPEDNSWLYSSTSGVWITDTDFANCADNAQKTLDNSYISRIPTDPINSGGNPQTSTSGYTYGYRGYTSTLCNSKKGQFYMLVAQLENKSDPERNSVRLIKDCDNATDLATGAWDSAFILTSE